MPKTYAEIEARVQENINSTVADVSVAIDNAIDFLGNFYENKLIDTSIATVASQDYINRPALCKEVERLEIGGVEYPKKLVSDLKEIDEYDLSGFIEYDGKINIYPTPESVKTTKIWYKANFTNLAGVAGAVSDVPDELIPLLVSIATWFFLEQQENMYDYEGADGWISVTDTWTFLSDTDNPTFTITVPYGATSKYDVGMKIKLVQTTTKYFIITKVENTKLTVYGGTDYVLTNAIISQIKYSTAKNPRSFPTNPDKWSIILNDTTSRNIVPAAQDVWYNVSPLSLLVPIGLWRLSHSEGVAIGSQAGQTAIRVYSTLSSINNGATDPDLSAYGGISGASGSLVTVSTVHQMKVKDITVPTTFYLNVKTPTPVANVTQIVIAGDLVSTIIKAECAYL